MYVTKGPSFVRRFPPHRTLPLSFTSASHRERFYRVFSVNSKISLRETETSFFYLGWELILVDGGTYLLWTYGEKGGT